MTAPQRYRATSEVRLTHRGRLYEYLEVEWFCARTTAEPIDLTAAFTDPGALREDWQRTVAHAAVSETFSATELRALEEVLEGRVIEVFPEAVKFPLLFEDLRPLSLNRQGTTCGTYELDDPAFDRMEIAVFAWFDITTADAPGPRIDDQTTTISAVEEL